MVQRKRHRSLARFLAWRRVHVTDQVYQFVTAALLGLLTGTAAFLLKWLISLIGHELAQHFTPSGFNPAMLWIPLAGIVLTGLFQRYVIHREIYHGVQRLITQMNMKHYAISPVMIWAYPFASTLTLGFGGSAGSEGPIASTGAAIGSNLARWLKMRPEMVRIMVGCGAGAGIAGIFKAPIGGALFTLEVLKLNTTTVSVMSLILACIVSSMTAYALSGFTVDLSYLQISQFEPQTVAYILLLGVVCGIYSIFYTSVMKGLGAWFDSVKRPWIKNVVSGMMLSVILFLFPAMFGEGYNMMSHLLNGDTGAVAQYGGLLRSGSWADLLMLCLAIVFLKPVAAVSSNSGGGVAGDFAPTLFAGCFLGFTFGILANHFCGAQLPVSAFAFMGMAGVMSGVIRAPYMSLFLTAEMTNGFILFLPLLGVTAISYGIVRLFRGNTYYNDPVYTSWRSMKKNS